LKFQTGALLVVTLFGASVVGLGFLVTRTRARQTEAEQLAHQGGARKLEALFSAPQFELTDQRGARVSKASLSGKPWVANFIFTSCKSVCPLLTAKMVQLQRKLPGANVGFVSFSVDPEHDDPMTLGAYAQRWAPQEQRWSLLATTPQTLKPLLDGFKVMAEKTDAGVDPIVHTGVFMLIDANGDVRGVYDSEHREEFQALVRDAAGLAGGGGPAKQGPRTGAELYAQLSCAPCHDHPALSPALGGLLGKKRELDNGLLVDADEGYLLESILLPDAKRVRGYPLKMPSYDGVVDSAELVTLLSYVKSMPEAAATPTPQTAEDPICHMQVMVTAETPSAAAPDGGRAYFCSESCRQRFESAQ
jgi:protein SCO1/2